MSKKTFLETKLKEIDDWNLSALMSHLLMITNQYWDKERDILYKYHPKDGGYDDTSLAFHDAVIGKIKQVYTRELNKVYDERAKKHD